MDVPNPFDPWVKLANNFIDILKWREAQRDRRFKLVVQPVLESLQVVHQDSLDMLRAARKTLAKTRSFGDAFEEFQDNRYEQQGMRHELIRRCLNLAHDPRVKDCQPFLQSVVDYFGVGPTTNRRLSERTELRLVRHAAAEEPNVVRALAELDFEIHQLQEAWKQIGDSYGAAIGDTV